MSEINQTQETQTLDNCNTNKVKQIYSFRVAEILCSDYSYFRNLITTIKKPDKFNPSQKKKVWLFHSTPEFEIDLKEVIDQVRAEREAKKTIIENIETENNEQ